MSFLTRVASLAAMSLCMIGLGNVAAPGRAAELTTVSLNTGSLPTTVIPSTFATAALPTPALPGPSAPASPDAPAARFASLEDAVAAQSEGTGEGAATSRSDEVACLAGAIYFEAKGEPLSGQLAVANVILNRVHSGGRFPADVCGVVTQHGQFSFVRDGQVPLIAEAARGYRTAVALAKVALAEAWDSPAPKALFFHARRVGMGRGIQIAAIGNHIFYR